MERVPEPTETFEAWSDKRGYADGDTPDLEPTADFFAKEFTLDENIKLAQISVAAEYENDLKAMDGKIKAMNHLEAARIQIEAGVDTH